MGADILFVFTTVAITDCQLKMLPFLPLLPSLFYHLLSFSPSLPPFFFSKSPQSMLGMAICLVKTHIYPVSFAARAAHEM